MNTTVGSAQSVGLDQDTVIPSPGEENRVDAGSGQVQENLVLRSVSYQNAGALAWIPLNTLGKVLGDILISRLNKQVPKVFEREG